MSREVEGVDLRLGQVVSARHVALLAWASGIAGAYR